MSENGNTTNTKKAPKNERRALGRGIQEILADQRIIDDNFKHLEEHVKAARIGAAILELVDMVEERYQPVIFKSVAAYRAVAREESTEEIGRKLSDLERQRIQQTMDIQQPKRRWYYLYLR